MSNFSGSRLYVVYVLLFALQIVLCSGLSLASDCNLNNVDDLVDVSSSGLDFQLSNNFSTFENQILGFSDIDGDGDKDMFIVRSSGPGEQGVFIRENNPSLSFSDETLTQFKYQSGPGVSRFAENLVSGNFRDVSSTTKEVIVPVSAFLFPGPRFAGMTLNLIFKNESNDFATSEITLPLSLQTTVGPVRFSSIIAGDFNQDGLSDIAITANSSAGSIFAVYTNQGNGVTYHESFALIPSPVSKLFAAGDLNGDSLPDILAVDSNDRLVAFLNTGSSFQLSNLDSGGKIVDAKIAKSENGNPFIVSLLDSPLRGLNRLVVFRFQNNTPKITQILPLINNGELFVADIDNDNNEDIIARDRIFSGRPKRLVLQKNGAFVPAGELQGLESTLPLFLVDLNNDNKAEIITSNYPSVSNLKQIYFNNSPDLLPLPVSHDRDFNLVPDECQRATAMDFDGDGRSDLTVARALLGGWYWFVDDAMSSVYQFGLFNPDFKDGLFAGDYDGNGRFEPGVVRDVNGFLFWYTRREDGNADVTQWGLRGDFALTGHFDLDKKTDKVVVRDILGGKYWFILRSSGEPVQAVLWGLAGDQVFSGDMDGDGIHEMMVARKEGAFTRWYIRKLNGEVLANRIFGLANDELLSPYDMDGDGKDNFVVIRRESGGISGFFSVPADGPISPSASLRRFGLSGDLSLTGSFTAPGAGELAVFRGNPSSFFANFFINRTTDPDHQGVQKQFGLWNDVVIGSDGRGKQLP
ncbi:MAG TPA: VCBS repeat-containing protein [Oligoflexia bacterium]|nr:VCBS repeat-containing protein [Oligoflexia bacterium]HMP47315.1 VCBS repeat-containing protein [Oligoflexia bacterium]